LSGLYVDLLLYFRGRAAKVNGVSQTPANSETTTLVSVSDTTTSAGSPPLN